MKTKAVPQATGSMVVPDNAATLLSDHPEPDGSLALGFLVTPSWSDDCAALVRRLVLVAFIDDVQVSLGDLGKRPAFELSQGNAALFSATMQDMPVDGAPHTFQIWQLEVDGEYKEAPAGEISAWSVISHQIGRMVW